MIIKCSKNENKELGNKKGFFFEGVLGIGIRSHIHMYGVRFLEWIAAVWCHQVIKCLRHLTDTMCKKLLEWNLGKVYLLYPE